MPQDRWDEVWMLYERASALPPGQRTEVLDSSADLEIRQHVAHLLDDLDASELEMAPSPSSGGDSGDGPAADDDWPELGRTIGRFTVTGCLGRGGSGRVYAGVDHELGRPVALKFLASLDAAHALASAVREARAAAALNHPHIVAVHDIIFDGGAPASVIVMELVAGEPLQRLCGQIHPIAEVARWGSQIAGALAAAHAAGIVHRDIKPSNIMLRPDGVVKVLDFGLARAIALNSAHSLGGLVAGTLRYMSPEQARGEPATGASDVYSLGLVLYELAAGAHPFAMPSALSTAHLIATRAAARPSRINPAIPPAFEDPLMAMLARDPGRRPTAAAVAEQLALADWKPRPWWGRLASPAARRVLVLALALALASGGWLTWRHRRGANPPAAPLPLVIAPASNLWGNEGDPRFSPDGRQLAFVSDQGRPGRRDIYIRTLSSSTVRRLTDDAADNFDPAWSPNGAQVAFLQRSGSAPLRLVVAPAGGGAETTIATVAGVALTNHRRLAWFPDGRALAVAAGVAAAPGGLGLYRLDLTSSASRSGRFQLLALAPSSTSPDASDVAPDFSPDGRHLAFLRVTNGQALALYVADLRPGDQLGEARRIVSSPDPIDSFQWMPDSRSLLYGAGPLHPDRLWRVAAAGGPRQPASFVLSGPARELAVAPRGNGLAYVRPLTDANIWQFDLRGRPLGEIGASPREEHGPRYSPDGARIVYASRRTGPSEIWIADADGAHPRQVTFQEADDADPSWSPDGRRIAYDSIVAGQALIWVVGADGGQPVRLGQGSEGGRDPAWSRDGVWIYFNLTRGDGSEIWKQRSSGGGAPIQVTFAGGLEGMESFDGRYFYYTKAPDHRGLWRKPTEGEDNPESPQEEAIPALAQVQFHDWEIAPTGIYFVDAAPDPWLKFFRFSTRRVAPLTRLPSLPTGTTFQGFSVAPSGQTFLYLEYNGERTEVELARR